MSDAGRAGARPARAAAAVRLSPLELRLYIAALLGAVYIFSWRAITGGAAAPATAPPATAAPARPTAAPPPDPRPAPRVVRAPASRPLRVRTRSS